MSTETMSNSSKSMQSCCNSNKYKMCRCNRADNLNCVDNELVTCGSSTKCFKSKKMQGMKALFHKGCGEMMELDDGRKVYFCLFCVRLMLRNVRTEHPLLRICSSKYFLSCNADDGEATDCENEDFETCHSNMSCSTVDGSKAAFHRGCGIEVNGKKWCQSCVLKLLKPSDPKRIFSTDVRHFDSVTSWNSHPFMEHLVNLHSQFVSPLVTTSDSNSSGSERKDRSISKFPAGAFN